MADDGLTEDRLKTIIREELDNQRREVFKHIGDAIGYDVGDPDELKRIRKDLYMVRATRLRSERFKAVGERVFFMFFWGTLLSALIAGGVSLFRDKLGI